MRLNKGQTVKCLHGGNVLVGKVIIASDTDPQSIAVGFPEAQPIRVNGGLAIAAGLALIVDYTLETVVDLHGNSWEIYVVE